MVQAIGAAVGALSGIIGGSGLGIAMASFLMVQDELESGQLHAPYGFLLDGSAYYLLSPESLGMNNKCARFQSWLKQEMAACLQS